MTSPADDSLRGTTPAMMLAMRLLLHTENRFARFVTWVSFIGLALGVIWC